MIAGCVSLVLQSDLSCAVEVEINFRLRLAGIDLTLD